MNILRFFKLIRSEGFHTPPFRARYVVFETDQPTIIETASLLRIDNFFDKIIQTREALIYSIENAPTQPVLL
jgi:hypothetical protein